MRAYEFITEMHDWHNSGIAGMKSMDGVGQYYDLYRFGLAMAASGRPEDPMKGEPRGDTEDSPTTLSYTDVDEKIINDALTKLGKTARQITPRKTTEPKETNTKSIVATRAPIPRRS